MEELKRVLLEAGVTEEEVEEVIKNLELSDVEDLRYYDKADDYEKAGVSSKKAQRKLVDIANDLNAERETAREVQRAGAVEAEKVRVAADETEKLAKMRRQQSEVSVLNEHYSNEESWTETLKRQGILEFDSATYIAGIKALLATNIGVFEAVPMLYDLINDFAIKNAKAAPPAFYVLQKTLTKRKFGLIVAAADPNSYYKGVPIYATESDIQDLINRMRSDLVPNIMEAARSVAQWYDICSRMSVNEYFMTQASGGIKNVRYPSPAQVQEAGQNLRLSINRTFAGNGIQRALAICQEYKDFTTVLNDETLPQSVGAVDRDGVLNMLGFDANAAAVRSEKYIIEFVLNIIEADKRKSDELQFCAELSGLVQQIDWSGLTGDKNDADLIAGCQSEAVSVSTRQVVPVGINGIPQAGIPASLGLRQMNNQPAAISVVDQ